MKRFYVDASAFIRLAKIDRAYLLIDLGGDIYVPDAVSTEIQSEPERSWLNELNKGRVIERGTPEWLRGDPDGIDRLERAASHLGIDDVSETGINGDVALLSLGMRDESAVIITDDKPLRKTCKTLGIPISGSIGVVISAVERGDLEPEEAKDSLVAMDEVGARLSARLLRKAEQLIDEAAEEREE